MLKKKKKKKKKKGWGDQIFASDLVSIEKIIADSKMQQRVETDEQAIREYQRVLADGGELPAIRCVNDETGTLWLWDGFHTLEAAKQAGLSQIRVEISEGTKRDAWLKSLGANAKHGIRRSLADKQKAVDGALSDPEIKMSLLEGDDYYSFRSIGRLCAVSYKTISRRWENIHYPNILKDIDEAVRQDPISVLIDNKERPNQIGQMLGVPAWLVEKRILIRLEEAEKANEEELTSGTCPTDQTVNARSDDWAGKKANEEELTSGTCPTDQTVDARSDDWTEEKANNTDLTSGTCPTRQAVDDPEPELLADMTIHHISKKIGVKDILAQRPEEGWGGQIGQEIDQALSGMGSDDYDSVMMLIVMVKT